METRGLEISEAARAACADRIGLAKLAKMQFDGGDLRPQWAELIAKLLNGTAEAGEGIDLALIAQLLGEKDAGLAIQLEVLRSHQLFRSPCTTKNPRLRVLALAAPTDMGSNTPIEFLLEESGIELMMLYVISEAELPSPLPEHDIAIVVASDSEDCRAALRKIDDAAPSWPRPLLNAPRLVGSLDRDKLFRLLDGIDGLEIPATLVVTRERLEEVVESPDELQDIASGLAFPVIIRPRGSHAGSGLAKIDNALALKNYLDGREGELFFISRFVDYSSLDGLYRKYRVVFVDGRPYACHMAIADRW
ncbi:MAG: hypothetical protein JO141_18200, partial [Bradyrhizobium sp.]|nr:hypothetical protein [Bradyrhizobium sp.]